MKTDAKDAGADDLQRGATGSLHVSYTPREDATPEGEIAALAAVFNYILFQRPEQKKTAGVGVADEAAEHARTEETAPNKGKP